MFNYISLGIRLNLSHDFSLGLSWLSAKVTPKKSYTSILESLKAAAFGLGDLTFLYFWFYQSFDSTYFCGVSLN